MKKHNMRGKKENGTDAIQVSETRTDDELVTVVTGSKSQSVLKITKDRIYASVGAVNDPSSLDLNG